MTDLVQKPVYWPAEWLPAIEAARGETPFSEFVRECVRARVGKKLTQPAKRGRPPKKGTTR